MPLNSMELQSLSDIRKDLLTSRYLILQAVRELIRLLLPAEQWIHLQRL